MLSPRLASVVKFCYLPAATALAIIAFASCGKPPQPAAPTPEPSQTPSPTPKEALQERQGETDKRLKLLCWANYVPKEIIDEFTRESGIEVTVENYASLEEMMSKLLAGGGYDLVQPGEYVVERLITENRLSPIDHAAISNLENVAPEFLNMSFDPENQFTIPYMAGSVGIIVNTARVKDEIKSYNDVFQTKYAKKIVVLDDSREIVSWALEALNLPVNDISDGNLAKVRPLLAKWLPLVRTFDSDNPRTALLNEDAVLGIMWSGEGAKLLDDSNRFRWVIPEEGSHLFVDSLAIPKGAAHPKNAQIFMNFILRPEVSVKISNVFPYLNPNAAARDLLTPVQRNNPASFPTADEIARMQTFKDIGPKASKIEELVTSLKSQ